jgi:hypothetical protein
MEPEGSLPHLQEAAICPYTEPDQSSPCPILLLEDPILIYSHICLGLSSSLLPSGFPTKILYARRVSPIPATCPAHLILLNLITRRIFDEGYRSLSSSLCSLLHSPTLPNTISRWYLAIENRVSYAFLLSFFLAHVSYISHSTTSFTRLALCVEYIDKETSRSLSAKKAQFFR